MAEQPSAKQIPAHRQAVRELRLVEPELQVARGMMRVCELKLIADLTQGMDLFISLGCGPQGCDMVEARTRSKDLTIVGFERLAPRRDFESLDIEYRHTNLWLPEIAGQVKRLILTHGRCLVYTDNGNKLRELGMVSPLLRVGDIIGTHDYPGEVPEERVGFLYETGFVLHEEVEPWIRAHLCCQRFWRKIKEEGST